MSDVAKIAADNDGFDRGYLICVSNLINMHGQGTEAEDLMSALGVTRRRIEALGFDDYDRLPLLKLRRDLDVRARRLAVRAHLLSENPS